MILDRLPAPPLRSLAGYPTRWSTWSLRSWFSTASVASVASAGSMHSIASAGSVLSIGSAGSILSVGSAGSILSIGSAGSILSVGSAGSILSIRSQGRVLCLDNRPVGPASPELRSRVGPGVGAVAGIGGAALILRLGVALAAELQTR